MFDLFRRRAQWAATRFHPLINYEKILARRGRLREIYFDAPGRGPALELDATHPDVPKLCPDLEALQLESVLELFSRDDLLNEPDREQIQKSYALGTRPFGLADPAGVLQVCFLKRARKDELPPWLGPDTEHTWIIANCFTARRARGRGLYPAVLGALLAAAPVGDRVVIFTDAFNRASRRGIIKAGFWPFALKLRDHQRNKYFRPLSESERRRFAWI